MIVASDGRRVDAFAERVVQQVLGLLLVGAGDAHLGLEDRDEPGGTDPVADLELLVGDRGDAVRRRRP